MFLWSMFITYYLASSKWPTPFVRLKVLVWFGLVLLLCLCMSLCIYLVVVLKAVSNLHFPYVRQMLYVYFLLQLLFGVAVLFLLRVCIFVCMHDWCAVTHGHECTCAQKPEVDIRYCPQFFSTYALTKGLLLEPRTHWFGKLANVL